MPIEIDGERVSLHDLKGTDLHCVNTFANKIKSKCAIMIYLDENNEIQVTGVWKTKKALHEFQERVDLNFKHG